MFLFVFVFCKISDILNNVSLHVDNYCIIVKIHIDQGQVEHLVFFSKHLVLFHSSRILAYCVIYTSKIEQAVLLPFINPNVTLLERWIASMYNVFINVLSLLISAPHYSCWSV